MKISIDNIVNSKYCLGCGLCVSVLGSELIEMVIEKDGYHIPHIKKKSISLKEELLRDFCPGITVKRNALLSGIENIYGKYISLNAAYSNDEKIRWKSSSGGCITGILIYLLESEKIDGVLHIGKSEKLVLESQAHYSRNREDVINRAGSRYAPSSLLSDFVQILNKGFKIAIVGKPCDIVGVTNFLNKYPTYKKQIICTISFMCMGMPSQNGTKQLIERLGVNENEIEDFWYRGHGWPGSTTVITKLKKIYKLTYEKSWGEVLCKDLPLRCKICPDGYGEFADISCGDAWYIKNGLPCFNDMPGRSLAFVRSEIGREIFNDAIDKGYLTAESFDINDLKIIQPSQYNRKIYLGSRILAIKLLGDKLLKFSGFNLFSNLKNGSIRIIVGNFIGGLIRYCKIKVN